MFYFVDSSRKLKKREQFRTLISNLIKTLQAEKTTEQYTSWLLSKNSKQNFSELNPKIYKRITHNYQAWFVSGMQGLMFENQSP